MLLWEAFHANAICYRFKGCAFLINDKNINERTWLYMLSVFFGFIRLEYSRSHGQSIDDQRNPVTKISRSEESLQWFVLHSMPYVAAASILPEVSEFRERVPGCSGNRFWQHSSLIGDGYRYGIPVTGSGGFVRMEDTAASRYYQNTISRLGGHDLLSQK